MSRAILTAVALAAALAATPAHAGQTCEEGRLTARELAAGMELAAHTAARLDASGAQVALLARAGQDLSKYNLRWSHLGLAYKQSDGAWRVAHKLNACGTDRAEVFRQGLGQFFNDRPFRYEAAFVVPDAALQARLLPLLRDNAAVARLHTPRYSMVAYAGGTRYQQSNQWALETLAMAAEPANTSRARAQAWLREQGYRPGVLHIDTFTRLGARLTRANVEFDDHPPGDRFAGRIATVTVDSVFDWLQRTGRAGPPQAVR
ncbi:DUF2145 domain-containing protein [Ideonella sp.]|uniref:DUF2145 domain-containing protein n=1 Tax=Ideonella sp. TaxID=1929293 RepID=UPI002B4A53D9|nr:DUF2145 domain-containing protein [Ideonella sp.]HJV67837.1 DUF2145 domain-containing protein [Ideonella sp.]